MPVKKKKRRTESNSRDKNDTTTTFIPQFQSIEPSRRNISELLSIIGANANVRRVSKTSMMKKNDIYGWLGNGDISCILGYCDVLVLRDDFIPLNMHVHGEISAAIINIISGFSDVLQSSTERLRGQSLIDNKNLLIEAAFAQYFIFMKEGTSENVSGEQSMLYTDESTNMFCFTRRESSVLLITGSKCFDATGYFVQKIWQRVDGEVFADFQPLLCDENFENSSGRLFAILPDKKLEIVAELRELQNEYTLKFGNYEADKSLSAADWDEISSLNATISEAESFELMVEEENKQDLSYTSVLNLSTVVSEERFRLFQEIKNKEMELKIEQEKFKYSLIPHENIAEARALFYETVDAIFHSLTLLSFLICSLFILHLELWLNILR
uniref:Uncharacterized protein n=1 Tax=Setaria digitata TaxID=48799 RepID=A0A915Q591_9BILA